MYSYISYGKVLVYNSKPSCLSQMVKNLLAMQKTQVWSLGQEDPLEKGMPIHSSILAWRIPWIEEPDGLQSMGSQKVEYNWATNTFSQHQIAKGKNKHHERNCGGFGYKLWRILLLYLPYAVVYTIYCIVYTVSMLSLHVDRSSGELELSQTGLRELIVNFSEILRTAY